LRTCPGFSGFSPGFSRVFKWSIIFFFNSFPGLQVFFFVAVLTSANALANSRVARQAWRDFIDLLI